MRLKSRLTICLMIGWILFSALPICAEGLLQTDYSIFHESADLTEEGIAAFENISPSLMNLLADLPVSDFENDTDGWLSTYQTDAVSVVNNMEISPYHIFEGNGMLRLCCDSETKRHIIGKKFETPIAASDQSSLCLTVNADETCTLSISLKGKNETLTKTVQIEAGIHTGIAVDISNFEGRDSMTEIALCVEFVGEDLTHDFYIDAVSFSTRRDIASIVHFMTSDYIAGGGTLSLSDQSMTFLMTEEGAYVETAALNYRFDEAVNAICVKLANFSSSSALTLYYATEDKPQYKSTNSYTLELYRDSEPHYYIFPIREREITQIRLAFDGDTVGLAHIYGIEPYSTYAHVETNYGTLDSVKISDNKNDIIIRGTIDDAILEIYKNQTKPIALYCLDPGDDERNIITLATSKVAQTDLAKDFKFVIPLEGTGYSRMNCKFAVGITTENGITLIDDCMYITNPEMLSEYGSNLVPSPNKKGIAADAYTADQLCADAYLEIDLSRLVSDSETEYSVETFGNTTYFDATYLTELDSLLERYDDLGVAVTAKLFYASNSSVTLFDMSDNLHVATLCHAATFLARRYSGELNVITDYVVDIETALYEIDADMICDRIKNAADYLRVLYHSISSVNSSVRIYMMVGTQWDGYLAYDADGHIGARQIIDMVGSFIFAEGDFPWNVALKLDDCDDYAFNEKNAENSYGSKIVSIKNIEMLSRYLKLDANLYDGKVREIIVIDQNADAEEESGDVAEYIYAYICMLSKECSNVERYILSRKAYSTQLQETMRYIDTKAYFDEYEQYALDMIGIADWSILSVGETDKSNLRTVRRNNFTDELDISVVGSYTVFDFSLPMHDNEWRAYANCSVISTGNQSVDHSAFLSASLLKNENFELSGIDCEFEYIMNFSAAPYLTLELQIAGDAIQSEREVMTISFFSDDHCVEYSGTIATSEWNHITIDLSDFEYNNRIDCIRVAVQNKSLPSNTTLMIGNIIAHSEHYTEDEINQIVNESRFNTQSSYIDVTMIIILVLVIISSGSMLILHLLSMNKKKS